MAPARILYMEREGLPSVLAILESPTPSILNGVPNRIMDVYCLEYSITLSVAPNSRSIGSKNTRPRTATRIPMPVSSTNRLPSVRSASSSRFSPSLIAA